jgi:hypothetical protein
MAITFPSNISKYDFCTKGEELIFMLFKQLPQECIVWYEVILGTRDRKPDFMILHPEYGIIIVEVKDWDEHSILEVSPRSIRLRSSSGNRMEQLNPETKCKRYVEDAIEKLEVDRSLVDQRDRLKFQVAYFVAFPNLTEAHFTKSKLAEVMRRDNVLCSDQITDIAQFSKILSSRLMKLEHPLTADMISAIRRRLRDEITIDNPTSLGSGLIPSAPVNGSVKVSVEIAPDVFAVDLEQESLAKDMGDGPRLLRGMAGTGKTLIMLIRAKILASNAESRNIPIRILILCWNISLANYMRQALERLQIPLKNPSSIRVVHFMEFARKLVSDHKEVAKFPKATEIDFEIQVSQRLSELEIRPEEKYDYIFVDEAQDFRDDWMRFLFANMVRGEDPKTRNFVVAADDAQRVYKSRNFTWKALGIPFAGGDRSKILRKVYRNSARVWAFAAFILGQIKEYYDGDAKLAFAPKRGVDPRIVECASIEEQLSKCVEEIRSVAEAGYSWRNVLILYHRNKTSSGLPIVQMLIERLFQEKIPCEWITESNEAKNTFDWTKDSVKISTALSAKGMDAPKVIIINTEDFGSAVALEDHDERKLLYVAITRAREEVVLLHTGDDGLVPDLRNALTQYHKWYSQIVAMETSALR